jgi:hypothetical protein
VERANVVENVGVPHGQAQEEDQKVKTPQHLREKVKGKSIKTRLARKYLDNAHERVVLFDVKE